MIVKQLLNTSDAFYNAVMSDLDYPVVILNQTYVFKHVPIRKKRRLNEVFMSSFARDVCKFELDSNITIDKYDYNKLSLLTGVILNVRTMGNVRKKITIDGKELLDKMNGQIVNCIGQRFVIKTDDGNKFVVQVVETTGVGFIDSTNAVLVGGPGIDKIMNNSNNTNMPELTLVTDYSKLGVGGLSDEFVTIFRRAFISRILPSNVATKLGVKHVRGMIMYGPPGCGKTLTARVISKMLNCKNEPVIVSGPEMFDKYVGESERKIRELFKDAIEHPNDFHVIIIDELDAICRKRGTTGDGGGGRVSDSIVNQLLAKIDGVDAIDNVLLIGMTNRLDVMDPALLRPGRFEVQIEVGLPDEVGRQEILKIHTKTMADEGVLEKNVNLEMIAKQTNNFTGAELEGLVKSAVSFATQRHVDKDDMSKLHDIDSIVVTESDFEHALSEVSPAFGIADEKELTIMLGNGIIDEWTLFKEFESVLTKSIFNREQKNMSILLHGPRGCGKTAILAKVGLEYNIPFVKLISASKLITMSENQRISEISSMFNDALRSNDSVILIDDIERVIEYVDIGPRFSNQMLQCLLVMMNKATSNKLTVILTSSMDDVVLSALGFNFDKIIRIPVPDDALTKEIIVELIGYSETSAPMMDGIKVPIKRFYM